MNIFGPPPESTEGSFWQVENNRESLRGREWHSFSSPVWFPVIQQTSESKQWKLFVQRRTGPLEGAITNAWRGNLIAGGLILVLLATSVLLVVIADQRLRRLANLQMNFVASFSHELRTPLAAMVFAGQNLSDGLAPDISRYGSIITNQAQQLIDLVDQILLFATMTHGNKKYHVVPLPLAEVLAGLRKTALPILEQAGFDVEFRIPENLPCVFADEEALCRCLRNLIENAAKYSGDSRWIGVYAELVDSTNHGKEISISIADHGMGIDSSELTHIFEPFYRGSRALAAQIHGSGLGLSVVEHIVKAIGGRVSVTSERGVGSVFTLHLRAAESAYARNSVEVQEVVTSA
jgi:signal transduction histidine kinase